MTKEPLSGPERARLTRRLARTGVLRVALTDAFSWNDSLEGYEYWAWVRVALDAQFAEFSEQLDADDALLVHVDDAVATLGEN